MRRRLRCLEHQNTATHVLRCDMLPCTTKAEAARRYFITRIRGTVHEQNKIDTSLFFSRPRQGGGVECAIKPSKTCQWKTKHFFYIRTQIPTYWFAFHSGLLRSVVWCRFSLLSHVPSPLPPKQMSRTVNANKKQQDKIAQRTHEQ